VTANNDAVAHAVFAGLTQSADSLTSCLAEDILVDSIGQRNVVDALYAIALTLRWIHNSLERLADLQEARDDKSS
jgi:hypothetical protein